MDHHHKKAEGDVNFSAERDRWVENNIPESTKKLLGRDQELFYHQSLSTPCLNGLKTARDIYIEDMQGRTYMDFHGNNVHQTGYGNAYVFEKVKEAMEDLPFSPRRFTNQYAVNFAEKLTGLAPVGLSRVLFAPGGTSAIGMALKIARYVTGSHKILSMWDSFHGASIDAIAAGGEALFRQNVGALIPGQFKAPDYNPYNGLFTGKDADMQYADYIGYVLEKEQDIGAVLVETIRNTTVHIPTSRFWDKIRYYCNQFGALLILDEIPIALGRTGKMFAFEHFDVVPDMLVLGKGLGGGIFPMAAVLGKEEFNEKVKEFATGHYTHEKSSVGSAAGLASLEFIEQENLLNHVFCLAQEAEQVLEDMQNRHSIIGDIRKIGLLWGIELVHDGNPVEKASNEAEKVMYGCMEKGLSFKVSGGNVLTLSPPLTIKRGEMLKAMRILDNVIKGL